MNVSCVDTLSRDQAQEVESVARHLRYGVNLTASWLLSYTQHYSHFYKPFTLQLRGSKNRNLQGAIPLCIREIRGTRFFTIRQVVPAGFGPSDFHDLAYGPEHLEQLTSCFAQWLVNQSGTWDRLFLPYIPSSSRTWPALLAALRSKGFDVQSGSAKAFYKVDTTGDWQTYERDYLQRKCSGLKTARNRLLRENVSLTWEPISLSSKDHFSRFIRLYGQRRQSLAQANAIEKDQAFLSFLKDVALQFEQQGRLRFTALRDSQDVWAYALDWFHNGIWFSFMPVFDDRFKSFGPGKLLISEILKHAFHNPDVAEYNFMRGGSSYKTQFATASEEYCNIEVKNHLSHRERLLRFATRFASVRDRLLRRTSAN